MPKPERASEFLPGDPNPPAERFSAPPEPSPPPVRRFPVPLLIAGGVVALALIIGGFIAIRIALGDPASRVEPGVGEGDAMTTLAPREGTPAPLQRAGIGERVEVEGLYGSGSVMVVRHEWAANGELPATAGRQYLNVEVRYDSAEGSLFLKPDYFAAYDEAKTEYVAGIGSGKPQLPSQELKNRQSATGWVSVEMPPGQAFFVISDEAINPLVMVQIPGP